MQKKLHDLSDPYIEAAIDFQEGSPLLLSDKQVKGPQLRIGEPSTLGNSIMRKKTTAGGCYTCKPLAQLNERHLM